MSRRIYGRIQLDRGYCSETWIDIDDTGWVFVEEEEKWYPPNAVSFIDPADEKPGFDS